MLQVEYPYPDGFELPPHVLIVADGKAGIATIYEDGDTIPDLGFGEPDPDWDGLYDDLDDSALLTRIVQDSIEFPQVATPLSLLIALITTTRKLANLQDRLNLVANVLQIVGRPLTPTEEQWLNERLTARGFSQSV